MDSASDTAPSDATAPLSRWARATRDDPEALRELAGSYWYCAYSWWRRSGLEAESAAMATLAAFTHWSTAVPPNPSDPSGGRMREWLPARLAELAERGVQLEGEPAIAIEPAWAEERYAEEPEGEPDTVFQRRWALTVLEFTIQSLRAEYEARGQAALFAEVSPFAGFEGGDEASYTAAANRAGMTVGGMRKAVFDFRTRHREVLRAFVGDTVADPADLDSEITALLCACDAPGATPASLPTVIRQHKPDELLARAMRTVQMTSGGAGQWTPPSDAEIGQLFPQYEMLGMLGRGGMGAVYKARQIELDRLVAIKLLPLEVSVDKDFADRFRREARAMARLNHPNIIAVHDFGTTKEGHLYFAMEYVEGVNLADAIHQQGLSTELTLSIAEQVCTALAYAHGKGIVHRDIKPANVMISTEGQVKVADFGLARLTDPTAEQMGQTMTGTVMGTPDYMAPEQMRGMNVDHRADIYSLGVMLYEMLCKEVPKGIFDPPSHRTGCDERIDQIVIKAMNSSPDRRYQSTEELKTAVVAARTPATMVVSGATQVIHPQPVAKSALAAPKGAVMQTIASPAAEKSKIPLYAGIAAGVLAVVGGVIFLTKREPKPLASPKTELATPSTSTALEPGAIRLWDTPASVAGNGGAKVEDGRLILGGTGTRGGLVAYSKNPSRDAILRASICTSPELKNASLRLRSKVSATVNPFYMVGPGPNGNLKGMTLYYSQDGKLEKLREWPLPRTYGPDDWMKLELHSIGEELTVVVDGQKLGTVRDNRLLTPGGPGIFADSATVRDIEYVPLDKPTATAATATGSAAPLEPGAIKLWDTPPKIPKEAKVRWEDGELIFDASQTLLSRGEKSRDGIVRASLRRDGTNGAKYVGFRAGEHKSGGYQCYRIQVHFEQSNVVLHCQLGGENKFLKGWRLPRPVELNGWVQLELRVVGDELTVSADGQTLGTFRDSTLTEPGGALLWGEAGSAFRNIVYVPLDKPAAVAANLAEPWRDWIAETRIAKRLEKVGFDDDGVLVRTRAPMGADWPHLLTARDGAIRATWKLLPEIPGGSKEHYIALRQTAARGPGAAKYLALVRPDGVRLRHFQIDAAGEYRERDIARWPLPAGVDRAQEHTLELRAVGDLLTVILNGKVLGTAQDSTIHEGAFAFFAAPDTAMRKMEFVSLDSPGGAAAPAAPENPATPMPATPKAAAVTPAPATPGVIDLLALVDVKRDRIEGEWKLVSGELLCSGNNFARLAFDYAPPDEYDFRILFTRTSGNVGVSQHLTRAGKDVMWIMGGFGNSAWGLEQVRGRSGNDNPTTIKSGLENGRRYESVVKVRRDRVLVEVDGKQVVDYKTDWSDFGVYRTWTFPDPKKLGVGCQQPTTFHRVEVLPLPASQPAASGDAGKPAASTTPASTPATPSPQSATAKWLAEQEPQWRAAFVKEVSGPFEKGVADLKKQYLAALETQLAAATKAAKLDDAVALRAERDRLAGGGEVPAEDEALAPASLKTLRASYRAAFAKLDTERFSRAKGVHARYDAILAQSQTALTQRQRLDEALEIKTQREVLSAAWLKPLAGGAPSVPAASAEPAPAAPKPASGAATIPPPSKTPKLKPRELVERLLAMGATITGKVPGSPFVTVGNVAEFPGEKFEFDKVKFFKPREGLTEADLDILEQLGDVADLDLAGLPATDVTIERLRRLPKLRALTLRPPNNITAAGFKAMAELPALQSLDMNIPITTECLVALGKARQLNYLLLFGNYGTGFTEEDFAAIASIPALARLTLITNQAPPPAAWARLSSAKNLIDLQIGQVPASAVMIGEISKLAGLENLTLDRITFPDAELAPLGALKSLQRFRTGKGSTLDGSVFAAWPLRPSMKSLSLISQRSVSDNTLLAIVTAFPKLERLDVNASAESVTAAGFAHLTKLKQLSFLAVTGDALDDAGLAHLTKCELLYYLGLGNARVTEVGVQSLPKLSALRDLDWINPPVTETALKSYGKLRALTQFRIGPETTPEIEQKLKAALPKVKIVR